MFIIHVSLFQEIVFNLLNFNIILPSANLSLLQVSELKLCMNSHFPMRTVHHTHFNLLDSMTIINTPSGVKF